jgi:hypothetical protein
VISTSDELPRLKIGSILRRSDGKRFVVRSIHKAEQPHTGFSVVIAHEPWPHPLVPHKQQRKKKRRPRWFR